MVKKRLKTKKPKTLKEKKKKKTSKKGPKISANDAKILKSLKKQFTIDLDINSDPNADVPYVIDFKHKGLQYITGGIPGGLFMEIHGPSQCGKSYLMYDAGMAFIEAGGWFYQNDAERAYKKIIGRKIGLEGNFHFAKSRKRSIEQVFADMQTFVLKIRKYDKKCPILTAIDSYNFLRLAESIKKMEKELKAAEKKDAVTPFELEGFIHMRKNNVFSVQLKDYLDFIEKYDVTFLLLSQEKIDYSIKWGDKRKTNAERVISYDCSLRLRGNLRAKIKHKKLDKIIGRKVEWECIKSRHPDIPPFGRAVTEIIYKEGIREFSGLEELFVKEGRAENCKIGKFKGLKFPNGDKIKLAKIPEYVKDHPKLLEIEV